MNTVAHQAAALVLSALTTLALVAGVDGMATAKYVAADTLAMSAAAGMQVAVQHVTIVGHRADA